MLSIKSHNNTSPEKSEDKIQGPIPRRGRATSLGTVEAWGSHKHMGDSFWKGCFLSSSLPIAPHFPHSFHYPTQISASERTSNKRKEKEIFQPLPLQIWSQWTLTLYTPLLRGHKEIRKPETIFLSSMVDPFISIAVLARPLNNHSKNKVGS